jgi:hypothetical protein
VSEASFEFSNGGSLVNLCEYQRHLVGSASHGLAVTTRSTLLLTVWTAGTVCVCVCCRRYGVDCVVLLRTTHGCERVTVAQQCAWWTAGNVAACHRHLGGGGACL